MLIFGKLCFPGGASETQSVEVSIKQVSAPFVMEVFPNLQYTFNSYSFFETIYLLQLKVPPSIPINAVFIIEKFYLKTYFINIIDLNFQFIQT